MMLTTIFRGQVFALAVLEVLFIFIGKAHLQREGKRDLPSVASIPKWPQWAGAKPIQRQKPGDSYGSPTSVQDSKTLSRPPPPCQDTSRELNGNRSSQDTNQHSYGNLVLAKWGLSQFSNRARP